MIQKGPPRVRGLILALVAVLILMVYAFWRAAAGPRSGDHTKANALTEQPSSAPSSTGPTPAAASAGNAPGAAATEPASEAGAPASGVGGQRANAAPPPAPPPAKHAGSGSIDEPQLMARLRAIKDSDPAGAVTLARDGNRRFPDSADAPERTAILVHALVAVDERGQARGEAERMVNRYPDSDWVREVERFTGAHRHRNVHVNDAGQLIFQ